MVDQGAAVRCQGRHARRQVPTRPKCTRRVPLCEALGSTGPPNSGQISRGLGCGWPQSCSQRQEGIPEQICLQPWFPAVRAPLARVLGAPSRVAPRPRRVPGSWAQSEAAGPQCCCRTLPRSALLVALPRRLRGTRPTEPPGRTTAARCHPSGGDQTGSPARSGNFQRSFSFVMSLIFQMGLSPAQCQANIAAKAERDLAVSPGSRVSLERTPDPLFHPLCVSRPRPGKPGQAWEA